MVGGAIFFLGQGPAAAGWSELLGLPGNAAMGKKAPAAFIGPIEGSAF